MSTNTLDQNQSRTELLTTKEAAIVLRRSAQTLRKWACTGEGPVQPVRLNATRGPLLWRRIDIDRVIGGNQ